MFEIARTDQGRSAIDPGMASRRQRDRAINGCGRAAGHNGLPQVSSRSGGRTGFGYGSSRLWIGGSRRRSRSRLRFPSRRGSRSGTVRSRRRIRWMVSPSSQSSSKSSKSSRRLYACRGLMDPSAPADKATRRRNHKERASGDKPYRSHYLTCAPSVNHHCGPGHI